MNVRIFCGAHAYACIEEDGRKTDILLAPGKSAQASLREYAQEQRERAARILAMAETADKAALVLDPPDYIREGETLWNGARVTHCLAIAYNRLSDRIAAFEREGKRPPDELLNGRHKLIAQAL